MRLTHQFQESILPSASLVWIMRRRNTRTVVVTSVEGRMIQNVLMLEAVTTSMLKKVWKLETSATAQYAEIGQARVPQEFSFTLPMSHGFDNVAD